MFKLKSDGLFICFLALIAATPALATDMYLAAIPRIATLWGVAESAVNLSLVLWFVAFSVFLLVCGPLSDKYGRRPVLLVGLGLFVFSSFACATAKSVPGLVMYRILQGIGASAPASMSLAICRDRFEGVKRQQALAYLGVILAVAPMVGPSIGTLVMKFASWNYIFVVQGCLVLFSLLVSVTVAETSREFIPDNVFRSMFRYKKIVLNRRYIIACMVMGLIAGPFYGYIAFSPVVYLRIFGQSERLFSILFGANAACTMMGAFTCAQLAKHVCERKLITVSIVGCIVGASSILLFGPSGVWQFFGSILVFSFFCGMSRPLSTDLVISQVEHDIGSASSFLVFYQFIIGAFCMWFVTQPWSAPVRVFGALAAGVSVLVLMVWPLLLKMLGNTLEGDNAQAS